VDVAGDAEDEDVVESLAEDVIFLASVCSLTLFSNCCVLFFFFYYKWKKHHQLIS